MKTKQQKKSALAEHHHKKKIIRELSIEREKVFKHELQQLEQTHKDKLSSAFALLDQATEKHLASESSRIISKQKVAAEKENSAALSVTTVMKQKKVLAKEKGGNLAALVHLEKH